MMETLEGRRLASATVRHARPVFHVDAGTLSVSGSVGNDVIVLSGSSGNVWLNLNGRAVRIRQKVRRAVIYGGAGNDLISCGGGLNVDNLLDIPFGGDANVPVHADGGPGRDTLCSGNKGSTMFGGNGDDWLEGMQYEVDGPENTYFDGGAGNDTLRFGNEMHGGSGDDTATVDRAYGSPIFVTGMETQNDLGYGGGEYGDPYAGDSNLATRAGRLVLSYFPARYAREDVSGPYVRKDGRIGFTVRIDQTSGGQSPPPSANWSIRFSDRQTQRALSRGIVLSFTGSDSESPEERVVLVPSLV